jgi:glyoxylase-like metal-dependent hydrolase (beta-lactamase superfamily II)
MAFLTEAPPPYGTAVSAAPGIRRIVAPNPGRMTYHGTNTWLLAGEDGTTIIDPGPDDPAHVQAILAQAGPIARILLTHTHPDHAGAAAALREAGNAPVFGWHAPWLPGFTPDATLADGETIAGLTAIHTPGHASDHLCFAAPGGVLFSGDHVMSWSTSVVSPPDGDMAAYMASLRRLIGRPESLFLCGHGPALQDPQKLLRALLVHRVARENAVLAALDTKPQSQAAITEKAYPGLDPALKPAAARNVLAHLQKLAAEGLAQHHHGDWTTPPS